MYQTRFLPCGFARGIRGIFTGILISAALRTGAQTDVGNFKVPDIDENGVMVSMMTGQSARMFPGKPMEINHLSMEFYQEDGKTVKLKILSPFCNYDPRTNTATSEKAVKIEAPQFTITGEGYVFEAAHSRMIIKSNVNVQLRNLNIKPPRPRNDAP